MNKKDVIQQDPVRQPPRSGAGGSEIEHTTRDKFTGAVSNSVDDKLSGHIKPTIQTIILKYGKIDTIYGMSSAEIIASKVTGLNPDGPLETQSRVWVPLIWKALNLKGYDVNPEWFKVNLGEDPNNKWEFDDLVKELSNLEGWAEYAIEVLKTTGNIPFEQDDNDFDSKIVKQLSEENNERYKGQNFDSYKMKTHKQKYLKYKNKYLKLKKLK